MSRHLDLGCGAVPRNPYGCTDVFGVDLALADPDNERFKAANLAVEPIPFPNDHFDSVSAYDFLEHVPRVLLSPDGRGTRAPFIELMNEIWRVLAPGGRFYASTPAYPHPSAFKDPTHVNIITAGTHEYFARPHTKGRMYGFIGDFEVVRVTATRPDASHVYEPLQLSWPQRLRRWHRRQRGRLTHVVWEFRADKPAGGGEPVVSSAVVSASTTVAAPA